MPPHPFFRDFLNYFGAQLHHLPLNTIAYLAAFVSMCENFLGCQPHWELFKHIFTCRSQSVKKASLDGERTHVTQLCGGLGIQMRGRSAFPTMTFPDSVRWFYCNDIPCTGSSTSLLPYTTERVNLPSSLTMDKEVKTNVGILVTAVV